MTWQRHVLIAGTVTVLAVPTVCGCQEAPSRHSIVVRDVAVLPMDRDTLLTHHAVVVEDGFVAWVGPDSQVAVPEGARSISGAGHVLLPGLVDAHVHLRDTTELASYLAHGVTTVIQLSGPQEAVSDLRGLREDIASGRQLGPRLVLSGRLIDGDPPIYPGSADVVKTPEEARDLVRARQSDGYDIIKVYNNLSRDAFTAVVEEAHRLGMVVFGHVPRKEGREGALEHALSLPIDVIAHGEEFFFTRFYRGVDDALDVGRVPEVDTAGLGEIVRSAKRAGVVVTPNLSFVRATRLWLDDPDAIFGAPEFAYLTPRRRRGWRQNNPGLRPDRERFDRREQAKARFLDLLTVTLEEGGVPLLAGTDATYAGLFAGASLITEIEEMERAGLSPFEALRAATVESGRVLMRIDHTDVPYGVVRPGARADLVLVKEDPRRDLSTLRHPLGIVIAGRWVDIDTVQAERPTWSDTLQGGR